MAKDRRLIFTNGCFDVLHVAHVKLLAHCASLGARVVVGINSDASVSRLKGPRRPINTQEDRKLMLEACRYVDEVVIFDEDTPGRLIRDLNPDVVVKGGDYRPEDVVGYGVTEVVIFPYIEGYATSNIIK